MKQVYLTIAENRPIAGGVMKMRLAGDVSAITVPGQFINIKIDGFFLRRPISVCDWDEGSVTILYKIMGRGTEKLAAMTEGTLDVLTGLGNGFDAGACGTKPLLIGGGIGSAPMMALAKALLKKGVTPHVILGFNTKNEIFYENEFRALGCEVTVTTADGSYGIPGFVTEAMKDADYDCFFACGREPMLRAVYRASKTSGQLSFEERMGCGFGACMGCSCETVAGPKRICREGPVMRKEELLWND